MARRHLIISGTGRAGTTFLVQLLTRLGLQTGFPDPDSGIYENCNAGLEWDIRDPAAPYVVKTPYLCEYLDEVLQAGQVAIDHAIVPVRDLHSAAESRRDVVRRSNLDLPADQVAGGLFGTTDPASQEAALATRLYNLIYALARHDVPTTLLYFPRLATDGEYLYAKLRPILPASISEEAFTAAFARTSKPQLIHRFEKGTAQP